MLSGVTTNIVEGYQSDLIGYYLIVDGKDLVLSVGVSRDEFSDGIATILSSWSPTTDSAEGVFYENESTATNVFLNAYGTEHRSIFRRDIYNIAWGAEFVPLELLPDAPPLVTLAARFVAGGLEIQFTPSLAAMASVEAASSVSGPWTSIQDTAAGATSIFIETGQLPGSPAFFRLSAKP